MERLVGRGEEAADAANAEADLVAARIRQFVDSREFDYSDIAVLVRTLSSTAPFERAFDRLNIPFLLTGGRTFLEARETRDLLALLAALVNPLDEIPLIGVLRGPLVGLSDHQIYRMGREGWRTEFERRFGRVRELAGFIAPDRLIAMALDQCGYTTGLSDRARANVEKLLAWLRREFRDRPRPLAELLEDLEAAAVDPERRRSASARGRRRGSHDDHPCRQGARVSGGLRERAASRAGPEEARDRGIARNRVRREVAASCERARVHSDLAHWR